MSGGEGFHLSGGAEKGRGRAAVFFDRDGTLMAERHYCRRPEDVEVLAGVPEGLGRLGAAGFVCVVVTNQSGISRGRLTEGDYAAVTAEFLRQVGPGRIAGVYHCPDAEECSPCRKPSPGMLLEATEAHGLDLSVSWMVGDKAIDVEAGRRAGTRTILVRTGHGAEEDGTGADFVAADAAEAMEIILRETEVAVDFRPAVVIPARWGSSRFPGKPLALIAGKPLIRRVWERCMKVRGAGTVLVATDDGRIAAAAREFGAEVEMTREDHPSGTDRLAEVAERRPELTHIINVQGDEPLIDPELVEGLVRALREDRGLRMVTAAHPLAAEDLHNPNAVKVVLDEAGNALYFSRSAIPHARDGGFPPGCLRHLGIYGYTAGLLREFVGWPAGRLERIEQLEQLRALERGVRIRVLLASAPSVGVDVPGDVAVAEARLAELGLDGF